MPGLRTGTRVRMEAALASLASSLVFRTESDTLQSYSARVLSSSSTLICTCHHAFWLEKRGLSFWLIFGLVLNEQIKNTKHHHLLEDKAKVFSATIIVGTKY
ncbi:hypothetical protein BpHYR1_031305 [Brachionus plicatilis]|uniref:Uncharacterized protein n=1 Tax=Brachionus plicatilis TaxID=10195 RepID=A0A3M7T6V9_BRAPC|nr:hypothetical protein BpHYR1_031305 [Brachionus plicatilis]